jgi:beta-glucosidase
MVFPKGFLFGSATSSHQVEGNNKNDWSEWEHANCARLADETAKRNTNAPTRMSDYILQSYPDPFSKENFISGVACDHYNRFRDDFDIAKQLGHNAHRFSIEWSRIEPEEGKFDEKEIEHYRQVILALKERSIEPFVSLWHWPIPLWLRDKGGWLFSETPEYFKNYSRKVVSELGSEVKFWITLNEPGIYAANSFLKGIWPPQSKNPISYLLAISNLVKAHKLAYKEIKKINSSAQIGIAQNIVWFEIDDSNPTNLFLKKIADWWVNDYFLNKIKREQDFIGVNSYFHNLINLGFGKNKNEKISDVGWEIKPESLYHSVKTVSKYKKPIYVTENGLADTQDIYRVDFIKESLSWLFKAINEGVDVRGYLHWSLLDNFEWAHGFWPRFGLVEIDYKTLERKIRSSAFEYKKIIEDFKNI